jgi:hypothetical protein
VQDLAFGDQLGHGADGVLDGGVLVDPVLVVEVDSVGAKALQGALDGGADVGRAAVEWAGSTTGMGQDAELRGDDDQVASALQRLTNDFLAVERAVAFSGVDVGDAEVERAMVGADGFGGEGMRNVGGDQRV